MYFRALPVRKISRSYVECQNVLSTSRCNGDESKCSYPHK